MSCSFRLEGCSGLLVARCTAILDVLGRRGRSAPEIWVVLLGGEAICRDGG